MPAPSRRMPSQSSAASQQTYPPSIRPTSPSSIAPKKLEKNIADDVANASKPVTALKFDASTDIPAASEVPKDDAVAAKAESVISQSLSAAESKNNGGNGKGNGQGKVSGAVGNAA
ncbi:hypothetical protein CGRA01v4_03563 [Colletotrichum graminicola]|nr:hypothetical protein CGRA01v4_03563 [Colletotrichum graminicola]